MSTGPVEEPVENPAEEFAGGAVDEPVTRPEVHPEARPAARPEVHPEARSSVGPAASAAGSGGVQDAEADDAIRSLLLLMPRVVGRAKKMPVPEEFRPVHLTPRHLSLLACLLFDGPTSVNDLAAKLEVAPTTVSLMVSRLSREGILERREDDADRRRKIVSIAEGHRGAISAWLGGSAAAWREALSPLTPEERRLFVRTLLAYEEALGTD